MAGRKATQREMIFSKRGENLMNLRRCRVGDGYAKLMLRTLDDRIGDGNSWEMTFAELADEMEVSVDVAYDRAHFLRDRGLVAYELVNASTARYRFRIGRSNLIDFIPEPSDAPRPRRRGRPPGSGRSGRGKIVADSENISPTAKSFRQQRNHIANSETHLITNAPLTPTTAPSAHEPASAASWQEAEEALIAYGVGAYEAPLQVARERGVPPQEILAILAHAEAHRPAWGPGAVRRRILTALPGQPAADGWMAPSEEYVRLQRRSRRDAEPPRPEVVAHVALANRLADLERDHGATLDAMSDDDVAAIAGGLSRFEMGQFRRGGRSAVRSRLLELIAGNEHSGRRA